MKPAKLQLLLSTVVLAIMLITAIASTEIDDCYCSSVEYTVKNNYTTAPTNIELFINDGCVWTSYSLPSGVTELRTDSSTIFTFSTAATMDIFTWSYRKESQ